MKEGNLGQCSRAPLLLIASFCMTGSSFFPFIFWILSLQVLPLRMLLFYEVDLKVNFCQQGSGRSGPFFVSAAGF